MSYASIDISRVKDLARLWTVLRDKAVSCPQIRPRRSSDTKAAKENTAEATTKLRELGVDKERFILRSNVRTGLASHRTLSAIASLIQAAERLI